MYGKSWKRGLVRGALATAVISTGLVVSVAAASRPAASRPTAYCSSLPFVTVPKEDWGFHGGAAITGATGTYTRGHGTVNLTTLATTGIICQVDRVRNAPDRQIILSIGRHAAYASHFGSMFGVPGNIVKLNVRVKSSTDPACRVGTRGGVTIFASYNNVHEDSVQFSFSAACKDHRHRYTGPQVVTNVPPN